MYKILVDPEAWERGYIYIYRSAIASGEEQVREIYHY